MMHIFRATPMAAHGRHRAGLAVAAALSLLFSASVDHARTAPTHDATGATVIALMRDTTHQGAGVRVDQTHVFAALDAQKDDKISIARRGVATTGGGTVVATDSEGFAVIRFAATDLDRAGLTVIPFARADADFGDYARIVIPAASEESAVLEAAHQLFLFPRSAVEVSGTQPHDGGALVNNCQQLAGMLANGGAAPGHAHAFPLHRVDALLVANDVHVARVAEMCKTESDGLDRLIKRNADDAQSARDQASADGASAHSLQQKISTQQIAGAALPAAQARLAALQQKIAADQATADQHDQTVQRIKDYRSRHKRGVVAAVVFLLVGIAGLVAAVVLALRSRKKIVDGEKSILAKHQARDQLDQKRNAPQWRDVILSGDSGILKISGHLLVEGGTGAVIGRSTSAADINFPPQDVSRSHARLFVRDNLLWVVDLGSAAGTTLNGRSVNTDSPISVMSGDKIGLASHMFEVKIV